MNIPQKNTLNMWHATTAAFVKYKKDIDTNKALARQVDKFFLLHSELKEYGEEQAKTSVGATAKKNDVRDKMERQGFIIAANMRSLARENEDLKTSENMRMSKSGLDDMADAELLKLMRLVATTAADNYGALEEYGTDEVKRKEFEHTIEQFEKYFGESRHETNARSVATKRIKELLKEGQETLEDIDDLIYNLEDTAPDFIDLYFKARIIIDRNNGGVAGGEEPEPPVV